MKTRFDTQAKGNLEVTYYVQLKETSEWQLIRVEKQ